jgi:hypothetical protein
MSLKQHQTAFSCKKKKQTKKKPTVIINRYREVLTIMSNRRFDWNWFEKSQNQNPKSVAFF